MNFEFRRPLGLLLAGGGALGSWQAGCVDALARGGLEFDKVMGLSAGALCGAGYFLGRLDELVQRWRDVDNHRYLRPSLRLKPFSLFSNAPLWEAVCNVGDHDRSRSEARCEFIVVSLRVDDKMPVYWRFTPRGENGWDGPLAARLVASCSIPHVFPPMRIQEKEGLRTYIDGGVQGREWLRCDALEGCRDVIVLETIPPEEHGKRRPWLPLRGHEINRWVNWRQVEKGIRSLKGLKAPPRIFHFFPTPALSFSMIAVRSRYCVPALERGMEDGRLFLKNPARHMLGGG